MTRPPVDVRRAGVGDVEDVLLLWSQARQEAGRTARAVGPAAADHMRPRMIELLAGDELQVVLARWSGRPAGYAVIRVSTAFPVFEGPCLHLEHLFVSPDLRHHGVARTLLSVVAGIAERQGADQILCGAPPSAREAHRFLARLGFSPLAIRRVASTASLRRRLAGESRRGALDDLLSRRRSLRARAGTSVYGMDVAVPDAAEHPDLEVSEGAGSSSRCERDPRVGSLSVLLGETLELPVVQVDVVPVDDASIQRA